ncbi:MAG: RidA family protein [Planctomycetota bacterium]
MNAQEIRRRVEDAGFEFPPVGTPVAAYVPARICGHEVFVSGQVPWEEVGTSAMATGLVPDQVDEATAIKAAERCGLFILSGLCDALGDRYELEAMIKLVGFVACAPGYGNQPKVINGASELMVKVLSEDVGRHARSAIGVAGLPLNVPVEVEAIARIREIG